MAAAKFIVLKGELTLPWKTKAMLCRRYGLEKQKALQDEDFEKIISLVPSPLDGSDQEEEDEDLDTFEPEFPVFGGCMPPEDGPEDDWAFFKKQYLRIHKCHTRIACISAVVDLSTPSCFYFFLAPKVPEGQR